MRGPRTSPPRWLWHTQGVGWSGRNVPSGVCRASEGNTTKRELLRYRARLRPVCSPAIVLLGRRQTVKLSASPRTVTLEDLTRPCHPRRRCCSMRPCRAQRRRVRRLLGHGLPTSLLNHRDIVPNSPERSPDRTVQEPDSSPVHEATIAVQPGCRRPGHRSMRFRIREPTNRTCASKQAAQRDNPDAHAVRPSRRCPCRAPRSMEANTFSFC